MAYVNVMEWKAEQVAEWLQGLDDVMYSYAHHFVNNNVTGQRLLNLTVDDLYRFNVHKVGHQEVILESLEMLRNLHYNLDTESLQYVCLQLSCKATSLSNEIRIYGPSPEETNQTVTTKVMGALTDVLDSVWILISWLSRPPFNDQQHYKALKMALVEISLLLATNAQRERFAEKPVNVIRENCEKLADLSNQVIREVHDSLKAQSAYLNVITIKRKADQDDFGIVFEPGQSQGIYGALGVGPGGVLVVKEVRFGSMAHQSGRIEAGDEIVQVNYQTVVGWPMKKVLGLMEENPAKLILTLKKRPKHNQFYGQIDMKPFQIPTRRKKPETFFNNLPNPRTELLVAPNISFDKKSEKSASAHASSSSTSTYSSDQTRSSTSLSPDDSRSVSSGSNNILLPSRNPDSYSDDDSDDLGVLSSNSEDEDDAAFLAGSAASKSPTQSIRSVLSRPRSAPQRRATISGTSPSQYKDYINICEIWSQMKVAKENKDASQPSSTTSTLRSRDSGLSTMSMSKDSSIVSGMSGQSDKLDMRKKWPDESPSRPQTMASFLKTSSSFLEEKPTEDSGDKTTEHPFYMNLPQSSQAALTAAANKAADAARNQKSQQQQKQLTHQDPGFAKNPAPNPRYQSPPLLPPKDLDTPKKRPIPQPRSISRTNSGTGNTSLQSSSTTSGHESLSSDTSSNKDSLSRSLINIFPESLSKSAQSSLPVPTANFKSFKRVPTPIKAAPVPPSPCGSETSEQKPTLPAPLPEKATMTTAPQLPARSANAKPLPKKFSEQNVNPPPRPAKPQQQQPLEGVKMRQKSPPSRIPNSNPRDTPSKSKDRSAHRHGFVGDQ